MKDFSLKIPLIFVVAHCESDDKIKDKTSSIPSIMKNYSNKGFNIVSLNLIEPLLGYLNLFNTIYSAMNEYKITYQKGRKKILDQERFKK